MRQFGLLLARAVCAVCLAVVVVLASPPPAHAQADRPADTIFEARITEILEESALDQEQIYQRLRMVVTAGAGVGDMVEVEHGTLSTVNRLRYTVGDRLVLTRTSDAQGEPVIYITDYVRRDALLVLLALFVVVTVFVGRFYGFTSLIGMVISFFVVFRFVLPQILAGRDPIGVSILGSFVIVPTTFYLSHGVNRKTSVAIIGTIIALIVTGLLAAVFVSYARLSGLADEEAGFLNIASVGAIDMRGLLLAGIIIASLGVLDDITISQASVVQQLKAARQSLSRSEVYWRAMIVGRDHIASAVNTLVLVYAGASLPLLLLFVTSERPFTEVVNYELIAQEIVRTLVGCVGLVLAVPVTTLLASMAMDQTASDNGAGDPALNVDLEPQGHSHAH